ncbi:GNAT family N-acetyltransferase [Pigmentibacter sp. JX0631]|uniref:GNAT family N-acetyltransferase n=1 Tax=Pigmentibacter sp. JX0631 TaxID=2976982 RepID=UPI0024689B70|nr:GNAT family N-acetyltransferase [Pigmentibacter sp. JX0631]WGL58489.1 GNAT family N-acetyltransferase [Pigmentibacter sp. JX0631]
MNKKNTHLIIYKWKNSFHKVTLENDFSFQNFKDENITKEEFNSFLPSPELAELMFNLAENDPYICSLSNLTKFVEKFYQNKNEEYYNSIFLYIEDGKLISFLNVVINYDVAEIDYIFSGRQYRGKGVANFLLNILLNVMTKQENYKKNRVLLEVGINNIAALTFYKKFDFKQIATRKNYYKNKEDAVIMEKSL